MKHKYIPLIIALFLCASAGEVLAEEQPVLSSVEVAESGPADGKGFLNYLLQFVRTQITRPAIGTVFTVADTTAYGPSKLQTDSTPCQTAADTPVRPGVVAANFLPFGTLLNIHGVKGVNNKDGIWIDKDGKPRVFIVEDRMNKRFPRRVDFWFPNTSDALFFGRQKNLKIVVVGYGPPGMDLTTNPAEAKAPSTFKRAQARFVALTKTLSAALLTKINPQYANRHDVDCTPANFRNKF